MAQSLNGKVAIITGASGEIGKAIAIELAKQRVRIGLIAQNEEALQALKVRLLDLGIKTEYAVVNVASLQEVEAGIETITEVIGKADILINIVGMLNTEHLTASSPENWKRIIDINLIGTYNIIHTVLPQLLEKNRGDLINITPLDAQQELAELTAYNAAKFGITGLTEVLAQEVGNNNIRVSALTPSPFIEEQNADEQAVQPRDFAEYVVAQLKLEQRFALKNATFIATNPER